MGIDDESSHLRLCSAVADGVTCFIYVWGVSLFREPDAGNLPVRFDEREQETGPSQTGLRGRGGTRVDYPPGDLILAFRSGPLRRFVLAHPGHSKLLLWI